VVAALARIGGTRLRSGGNLFSVVVAVSSGGHYHAQALYRILEASMEGDLFCYSDEGSGF
jgi:hypothetical protein